ncbi:MAG: hypothetical protein WDN48_13825 [Pseudolabrys sp.]
MAFEVNAAARGESPGRSLFAWARWPWAKRRGRAASYRANVKRAERIFSGSRLIVLLAVIAMGVTALSAGVGYGLARQSDEHLWGEQRASLRNAMAEFRNLVRAIGADRPALRAYGGAGPQVWPDSNSRSSRCRAAAKYSP